MRATRFWSKMQTEPRTVAVIQVPHASMYTQQNSCLSAFVKIKPTFLDQNIIQALKFKLPLYSAAQIAL